MCGGETGQGVWDAVPQWDPGAKPRWGSGAKPPEAEHFFTNYKKF